LFEHREQVRCVVVLTKSRAQQITEDAVRRLAGFGVRLQVLSDLLVFESAMRSASRQDSSHDTRGALH